MTPVRDVDFGESACRHRAQVATGDHAGERYPACWSRIVPGFIPRLIPRPARGQRTGFEAFVLGEVVLVERGEPEFAGEAAGRIRSAMAPRSLRPSLMHAR